MTRAETTFHYFVCWWIAEYTGIRFWIHFRHTRRKNYIGTNMLKQLTISFQCTWVFFQILLIVKLGWIHKHTYNSDVILIDAPFYQRCMASMKGSHCRYKTNGFAFLTLNLEFCLQLFYGMNNFHLSNWFISKPNNCCKVI